MSTITPHQPESSSEAQKVETQVMESVTDENKDGSNLEALISHEDERVMRFDAQPFVPTSADPAESADKPEADVAKTEPSDVLPEKTAEEKSEDEPTSPSAPEKRENYEKLS
jgi:hypothetical protein